MTTFHDKRKYVNPDALRKMEPQLLLQFLKKFEVYFRGKGMNLRHEIEDYEYLAKLLMYPDEDMPSELVEALFTVYQLADNDNWDMLYEVAKDNGLELTHKPDSTAGDLAMMLYLRSPEVLEKVHAETLVKKPKTYLYYRSERPAPDTIAVNDDSIVQTINQEMNNIFLERKRGKGCKVFFFDYGEHISILVKHGKPFKREGCLKDGESDSVYYRPEEHHVLIYDRERNEIAVHSKTTKWQKEAYLSVIGKHLFGAEDYFFAGGKFTFEPLRTEGKDSLIYADVPGIDDVKLTEVHLTWPCNNRPREIRQSDDYFDCIDQWDNKFPRAAEISAVQLAFRFQGFDEIRKVRIDIPCKASFVRDDYGLLIEEFLKIRGFEMLPINARKQHETSLESSLVCS